MAKIQPCKDTFVAFLAHRHIEIMPVTPNVTRVYMREGTTLLMTKFLYFSKTVISKYLITQKL